MLRRVPAWVGRYQRSDLNTYGSEGWGFESSRAHHLRKRIMRRRTELLRVAEDRLT
jgi:hypothetical protein